MARTSDHEETEIKLDATGCSSPIGADLFGGMEVLSDDTVTLRAEYWDTHDLRLLCWGHELRYRVASDGGESGWTVKFAGLGGDSGVLSRREIEVPGDGQAPPRAVRHLVMAFTGHEALVPLATLTTDRHRLRLRAADGTVVEVTDDRVTSRVGRRVGPRLHELEVELIDGSESTLRQVAARLRSAGAEDGPSRAKIGQVVADQLVAEPPVLTHQSLDEDATVAQLVRGAITDGALRLLAHDPALRTGDDPEAVHQARVATRRLRSDLKSLEPLLVEGRVEPLRSELRWLGRLLGAVRDVDVLAAHLEGAAGGADESDAAAITGLVARLHAERAQRMLEVRDVLESDRYLSLVEDLLAAARTPPFRPDVDPEAPARRPARRLAGRAWKRTARHVRHLGHRPPEASLHEVRRRAKRARYAAELVAPVVGGKQPLRLADRLSDVQDVLGELQDTVVADHWLRRVAGDDGPPNEAFAAGLLVAEVTDRRHAARRRWKREWHRAARPELRHWLS